MNRKHEVVSALKKLASDLGRTPKRDEFRRVITDYEMRQLFGGYGNVLAAAGLNETPPGKTKKEKFVFKKSQIESFNVIEFDIENMIKKLGRPLKVIAMPDTHVKNRDKKAVAVFLEFCKWYNPDVFIIMGDFLDAEGISHWPVDSFDSKRFIPEIHEARELLNQISKATPNAQLRVFIGGNHEDWVRQAMVAKLPELFSGLDEIGLLPDIKALLELDRHKYHLTKLNDFVKLGNAHFTHGLYTSTNHAKKHLSVIKTNIYYGHLHDVQACQENSINGIIEAASLGCLCRLDAPFMKGRPSNWVHAFGVFEFRSGGNYSFYCPRIFNGEFSFAGKLFKA